MVVVSGSEGTEVIVSPEVAYDTFLEQARAEANKELEVVATKDETSEVSTETSEQTPVDQETSTTADASVNDEDKPKYSRRDAAKLAEQLIEANKAAAESQKELEAMTVRSQELTQEVARVLGTKEEYDKAEQTLLDPSAEEKARLIAGEQIRVWKANRVFYKKLEDHANGQVFSSIQGHFQAAAELPGVDRTILMGADLTAAFKNVWEAGQKSTDTTGLNETIVKLEAEIKGLKATVASKANAAPVQGGVSSLSSDISDWFDPKTGILKDEYAEAGRSGRLRG